MKYQKRENAGLIVLILEMIITIIIIIIPPKIGAKLSMWRFSNPQVLTEVCRFGTLYFLKQIKKYENLPPNRRGSFLWGHHYYLHILTLKENKLHPRIALSDNHKNIQWKCWWVNFQRIWREVLWCNNQRRISVHHGKRSDFRGVGMTNFHGMQWKWGKQGIWWNLWDQIYHRNR